MAALDIDADLREGTAVAQVAAEGGVLLLALYRWSLTVAEKEVALLLLKGLSHKEIAAVRSVTEATARQQARAVYKKSRLLGRHDLAAFFLEDLMLPIEPEDGATLDTGLAR